DTALHHLDRAIALADSVGNHFVQGIALVSATSVRARQGEPTAAAATLAEVLAHWGRLGNWRQQYTTLRHVTELFARAHEDTATATLLGWINANDGANLYGADEARLTAIRADLVAHGGPEIPRCLSDGALMQPKELVAFARERLAAIAARAPALS